MTFSVVFMKEGTTFKLLLRKKNREMPHYDGGMRMGMAWISSIEIDKLKIE